MIVVFVIFSLKREEEIEEYLRNKYGRVSGTSFDAEQAPDDIVEKSLLPGVR